MASHYVPLPAYASAPITTVLSHHPPQQQQQQPPPPQQQQHLHHQNPFGYSNYHAPSSSVVTPFGNTYIHARPALTGPLSNENSVIRGIPFCRPQRQGFIIETQQNQSSSSKNEPAWSPTSESSSATPTGARHNSPTASKSVTGEVNFGTEVDTLMKAIQSKGSSQSQAIIKAPKIGSGVGSFPSSGQSIEICDSGSFNHLKLTHIGSQESASQKPAKKRYQCTIGGCTKSFFQKTHLDIHERAHTGVKPYSCKQPGCNRTFSQLGNLKTHERRHTGERPYQCETCGKRFAQRGNVRAHKIVHDQAKPYVCILDECGKQFTQLGNLKSHQNKFHIATLRTLTKRWASVQDGDSVPAADKELWEYFAKLYKNSNKGIKGRGKDRKVGSSHVMSAMRGMGVGRAEGYGICGSGRGNMVVNLNLNVANHTIGRSNTSTTYSMYDDEVSNSGSGTSGDGSVGTSYDEAPSENYDETNRPAHMSFGERIY